MAGAEIVHYSTDQRGRAGAFVAGQLAALLGAAASAILHPIVVLPALIAALTDDWYLIALPVVLAGLMWPIGAGLAMTRAGRERPNLWALGGNVIRLAMVVVLAIVIDRSADSDTDALVRALLVCFAFFALGSAMVGRSETSVATLSVSPRRRPGFFRSRLLWSSLSAIAISLVAAGLLGGEEISLPDRFAVLFVVAAAFLTAALFFQSTLRLPSFGRRGGHGNQPTTLAARPVLGWVSFRILLALAALADPFLIVYALTVLDASATVIGLAVAAIVAGRLLTHPLWVRISGRGRTRAGLQGVALIRILIPALALTLPYLFDSSAWTDRVTDPDVRGWVFLVVFLLIGIAQGGQSVLAARYTADLSGRFGAGVWPLSNTVVALAAVASLGGAWILTRWGFEETFLAAGGAGLLAILLSGVLVATSGAPVRRSGSFSLRRPQAVVPLTARRN
ncbi:MAG TPA: hypothetical protein VGT61_15105 [Thermomicrobiales bacterium]|nr:hypothetical protein [Thermomicrobiales bacterium]